MSQDLDMTLTCRQCGKEFIFSSSEQEYYKERGFTLPRHCKPCRSNRQNPNPLRCSSCGEEIEKSSSIHCSVCLAAVHVECELETRKQQGRVDEAIARIQALETEKVRLQKEFEAKSNVFESEKLILRHEAEEKMQAFDSEKLQIAATLQQKEQALADLEQKFLRTNQELEKSLNYRANLEGLEAILKSFKERLDTLENAQNNLNRTLLKSKQMNETMNEGNGIPEIIKRIFRPHRRSPEPGEQP
jgi:hypothetical protein